MALYINCQKQYSDEDYLEEKYNRTLHSEFEDIDDGDYNEYLSAYWEYISEYGDFDE